MNNVEFCIVTRCAISLNQFYRNSRPFELVSKIKRVCSDVLAVFSFSRTWSR